MKTLAISAILVLLNIFPVYSQEPESNIKYKYEHWFYLFEGVTLGTSAIYGKAQMRIYYFNVFGFSGVIKSYNGDDDIPWTDVYGPTGISIPIYARMGFNINGNLNVVYLATHDIIPEPDYKDGGFGYEFTANFEFRPGLISIGYRKGPTFDCPGYGEYEPFSGFFAEAGLGLVVMFPYSKAQRIKKISR